MQFTETFFCGSEVVGWADVVGKEVVGSVDDMQGDNKQQQQPSARPSAALEAADPNRKRQRQPLAPAATTAASATTACISARAEDATLPRSTSTPKVLGGRPLLPRRSKVFDHALNAPETEMVQSQMPPDVPFLMGIEASEIRHPLLEGRLNREPPLPVIGGNQLIQDSPSKMGYR